MGFALFISLFLTLYGGMHYYGFLKVRKALALGPVHQAALALFLLFMVISPVAVRWAERAGLEDLGRVLAYAGYTWMGFLFLFVCLGLSADALMLLLPRGLHPTPPLFLMGTAGLAVLFTLYGMHEALEVRVERVSIPLSKIGEPPGRIRIAQISDVHLGLLFREQRLQGVLDAVRAANPDLLVSTGDLVDGDTDGLFEVLEMLRVIRPPLGKFAVIGNHEVYAGLQRSLQFMTEAGFRVLRDEAVTLPECLSLAGIQDPAVGGGGDARRALEREILLGLPKDLPSILLKHRPSVEEGSEGLFDLQLSGHTHNGQIFPFSLLVRWVHPRIAGLYPLASGSFLYVSRGSGTWGPPIRILSPPEVTVIDLVAPKRE